MKFRAVYQSTFSSDPEDFDEFFPSTEAFIDHVFTDVIQNIDEYIEDLQVVAVEPLPPPPRVPAAFLAIDSNGAPHVTLDKQEAIDIGEARGYMPLFHSDKDGED